MDPGDLRREWHANKHRPAWLRERRAELHEALTVDEPIPDSGALSELRDWLDRYAPTVTRQLDDRVADAHGGSEAETTTDADDEPATDGGDS